jgi:hypothetical protein
MLNTTAKQIAEKWVTNLSLREDVIDTINPAYLEELNRHFQQLLTASEKATIRSRYEREIQSILKDYSLKLVVPLKQAQNRKSRVSASLIHPRPHSAFLATAFLGQSFAVADKPVADCVKETLEAIGLSVVTGEKPLADSISEKLKRRINAQHIFVGLFTRRDKLVGKRVWSTSGWVIEEKAYALAQGKRLVLLKEDGVNNIGGLPGDLEYLEFTRDRLDFLVRRLIQLFDISVVGLRAD